MFGTRQSIRMIYCECRDKPAFLPTFEHKILTLVKTQAANRTVEPERLMDELRIIAKACKERNLKARDYLRFVADYAVAATEGNHKGMLFLASTLEIKKPHPIKEGALADCVANRVVMYN